MDDKDWYYLFLREISCILDTKHGIDDDDVSIMFIDEVPETMTTTETEFDNVNHPKHYTDGRKYEPIEVIEDWKLDFCLGNAVKYISRAGRKDETKTIEDLEKAKWYIDREIRNLKFKQKEESYGFI